MLIAITGSNGFIGKNLYLNLSQNKNFKVFKISRQTKIHELKKICKKCDILYHLAGANRPKNDSKFNKDNFIYTKKILELLGKNKKKPPIIYTSTSRYNEKTKYGISKKKAEQIIIQYSKKNLSNYYILRLPNVFGKWCKPNYNSFVATFCYNIINGIELSVNDPNTEVTLVYIDDVCASFIDLLTETAHSETPKVSPVYTTTVGEVAKILTSFKSYRDDLIIGRVGTGLTRLLYSTFLSYAQTDMFSYSIPCHVDARGTFCEVLKTRDAGQFSFFKAHSGVTRGEHYHHTKTEKFLVLKGNARFRFRHISTDEFYSIDTSGKVPTIVETIPGWAHDITNIGNDELIVMLWANEIFNPENPDTTAAIV